MQNIQKQVQVSEQLTTLIEYLDDTRLSLQGLRARLTGCSEEQLDELSDKLAELEQEIDSTRSGADMLSVFLQ